MLPINRVLLSLSLVLVLLVLLFNLRPASVSSSSLISPSIAPTHGETQLRLSMHKMKQNYNASIEYFGSNRLMRILTIRKRLQSGEMEVFSVKLQLSTNDGWASVTGNIDLKTGKFVIPNGVTRALVEVGTNADPDFVEIVRQRPELFYIMLEPITVAQATGHCRSIGDRCVIFPAAAFAKEDTAVFHVGADSKCSSLLSDGTGCGKSVQRIRVPLITLDLVLSFIPDEIDIELVSFDCQGVDLMAAAGLKSERHRVSYVFLECQDLPVSHPWFISPLGYSCGQAISCIREQWKDWDWRECLPNMGPREYNCIVSNRKHPLTAKIPQWKPTMHSKHPPVDVVFSETCPSIFSSSRDSISSSSVGNPFPLRVFSKSPSGCQTNYASEILRIYNSSQVDEKDDQSSTMMGSCDEKLWPSIAAQFDRTLQEGHMITACRLIKEKISLVLGLPKSATIADIKMGLVDLVPPYVYSLVHNCLVYIEHR